MIQSSEILFFEHLTVLNDNSETDELFFPVVFPERLKFHIKKSKETVLLLMSKKKKGEEKMCKRCYRIQEVQTGKEELTGFWSNFKLRLLKLSEARTSCSSLLRYNPNFSKD